MWGNLGRFPIGHFVQLGNVPDWTKCPIWDTSLNIDFNKILIIYIKKYDIIK